MSNDNNNVSNDNNKMSSDNNNTSEDGNKPAITRRGFIRAAGIMSAGAAILGHTPLSIAKAGLVLNDKNALGPAMGGSSAQHGAEPAPGPDEARRLLEEGNTRYVQCEALGLNRGPRRRIEQYPHQTPFCGILGCIDSRVPEEIFFDRGVGDMFVPRSAGQTLDSAIIGSLEFAVYAYHIPLIMVLGHEECGAVKSAIEYVDDPRNPPPGDILYIVKEIAPAVPPRGTPNRLQVAIKNNVLLIIEKLKARPIIAKALREGSLKIIGAECYLKSAEVKIY